MSNFFRVQKTKKIKSKRYLKQVDSSYGIPTDPDKLKKWFIKEERRVRKENDWNGKKKLIIIRE